MEDRYQSTIYIWDRRVLHISRFPDIAEHRLGAAALIIGLDGTFSVLETETENWRECRTALIPPGCVHENQFGGTAAAILHIEPESIDYMNITGSMPHGDWQVMYDHIDEENLIQLINKIHDEAPSVNDAKNLIKQVIYGTGYDYENEEKIDPRIRKVLDMIRAEPSASYSMEELAEVVNLSPTRFIHLFKEQTGVPIRRFRQWVRMKTVITYVADGSSLTDAALDAGFTDSAHFSRAFRNMFGITPSSVFNRSQTMRYFVEE
ncbi:transcriptional regulator, AraC family [gamma proteobacterium HTCC5015]|nr:transcriptional regulator, AraC family [gamma proteobacterium HTCC5015]